MTSRSMHNNYIPCQQVFQNVQRFSELSANGDDGYCTDSRSNTTASISSHLSSSLSSLSTSEGSSISGVTHLTKSRNSNYGHNSNLQSVPIQKGPNLHVNTRANVNKNCAIPAKRRVKVEEPDTVSSLEDQLRALTTIEEEEAGQPLSDRGMNIHKGLDNKIKNLQSGTTNSNITGENINFDTDSNCLPSYYRALPTSTVNADLSNVSSNPKSADGFHSVNGQWGTGNVNCQMESQDSGVFSMSHNMNGDDWKDYVHFFEKDCNVLSHNIDIALQREFSGAGVNNIVAMDTHRQGSPMISRKQGFGFSQNVKEVIVPLRTEPVQNLVGRSGQDGGLNRAHGGQRDGSPGLDANRSGGDNSGTRHSLSETPHLLSCLHNLQSQAQSRVSEQMPGLVPQNQAFTLQDFQFYEQLQQQQLYQQQQQQQQFGSHGLANHTYNGPWQQNTSPVFSDHSMNLQLPYRSSVNPSAVHPTYLPDQASLQSENSFDQHLAECRKPNHMGLERSSLDLGSIPQLQRQIRATSELCLQASRRHIFASSADIHRLFSGQKKPTATLHVSESSSFENDQNPEAHSSSNQSSVLAKTRPGSSQIGLDSSKPKPKLQVIPIGMPPPIPIRADHSILIPPEAWTNVTSLPNSASVEVDRLYVHLHNQLPSANVDSNRSAFRRSMSSYVDATTDRSAFQRSMSSCADATTDRSALQRSTSSCADSTPDRSAFQRSMSSCANATSDRSQVNCLSSGYSSETELQQIESNAEAIKKLLKIRGMEKVTNNQGQEFIPLNRSIDHDSSTDTDSQLVYENQSSVTSDSLNQHLNSVWFSEKKSPGQEPPTPASVCQLLPPRVHEVQSQARPSPNSWSTTSFFGHCDTITYSSSNKNVDNIFYQDPTNAHKESNNLISKSTIMAGHVGLHPNIIQEYSYLSNNINNNMSMTSSPVSNTTKHNSYSHVLPECNSKGHSSLAVYSHGGHPIPHGGPSQTLGIHLDYSQLNSNLVQFPISEVAHLSDVPFETNIISDDQGDRLSTLV